MKALHLFFSQPKTLRGFLVASCAFCWAYALVIRLSSFMVAPRSEKVILLGLPLFFFSILGAWVFSQLLPRIMEPQSQKAIQKIVVVSIMITAILFIAFYQVPPFPEHHILQIIPDQKENLSTVEVVSIHRRELPGQQKLEVPPGNLEIQGVWYKKSFSNELIWRGGKDSRLTYNRFMQAEIEVVFRTGPQKGQAVVGWDGETHFVNFNNPTEGLKTLVFQPAFNWRNADQTRKVLLGISFISEFFGLTAFISIISFFIFYGIFRRKIIFRSGKTVIAWIAILFIFLPLSYWVNPPAQFQDVRLEAAIREALDNPDGVLRLNMLRTIAELDASQRNISSLEGIQQLRNLVSLDLRNNLITDISPLSRLQRLRSLNLRANAVRDISPLASLHKIEYLNLHSNSAIVSILPLRNLRSLEKLILANVTVGDQVEILGHLTNLHYLNLRNSGIEDISPLANLNGLAYLNLHSNPSINSIVALNNLPKLETLLLAHVPIGDQIGFLQRLPNLKELNIRDTGIQDLSFLSQFFWNKNNNPNTVKKLSRLDIRDNPIPLEAKDGYAPLRAYWQTIPIRAPLILPDHNTLQAPKYSHTGGFYEQAFWLEITSEGPDVIIHYTLDGSEPSESSPIYKERLLVSSRIGEENKLSSIETTSPEWEAPDGEVLKATIVRARVFDPANHQTSPISTQTFFVGEKISSQISLPIVSIVTDPNNLFDYLDGIYVKGRIWDIHYGRRTYRWTIHPANYRQTGIAWERPVHFEFFEPGGLAVINQNGTMRIHGGATRAYRQKSIRLYAENSYDQFSKFNYDFFSEKDEPQTNKNTFHKTLLLRNSGTDWSLSMFRDAMAQNLVSHAIPDIQKYRPIVLFLNGEYWGIHNLRNRIDNYFLSNTYNLDPEKIEIYDFQTDIFNYSDLLVFIENYSLSEKENYIQLQDFLDVNNFTDYFIAEIYSRNTDWPQNNVKFWRYKTNDYQPDTQFGMDGRWRWILFDLDGGFGAFGEEPTYGHNSLFYALNSDNDPFKISFIFRSLMDNTEFREQFINRFADHLNTSFEPQRVIGVIDEMQAVIAPDMPEHIRRWRTMDDSVAVWEENVEVMRTFARHRPDYVRQHLMEYFDLPGTAQITLQADASMGHIRINSIDITTDTPGVVDPANWRGIYFQGIPVTISAISNPGFSFAGWQGIDEETDTLELILNEDMNLKANFVPIDEA